MMIITKEIDRWQIGHENTKIKDKMSIQYKEIKI